MSNDFPDCPLCGGTTFFIPADTGFSVCDACYLQCLREVERDQPPQAQHEQAVDLYCLLLESTKTPPQ